MREDDCDFVPQANKMVSVFVHDFKASARPVRILLREHKCDLHARTSVVLRLVVLA